jgi:hypothetical protein
MLVAAYMQLDVIIVFMGSACCGIAIEMQARFCSFEKIQPITLKLLKNRREIKYGKCKTNFDF